MKKLKLFSLFLLLLIGVGQMWADDPKVDITSLGTQTWTSYSLTSGVVTISTNLNSGSAPTTSNAQYRWKANNIITISLSSGTIKSIQFKTSSTETYGPKCLSYNSAAITSTGTDYTWTAPTNSLTSASFTVTSEARLTEIHVTYTTSGGGGQGSGGSEEAGSGTINFGSASGSTNVNAASKTGDDSREKEWTITTVFKGTESFTANAGYAQIGASNKGASSITFTTTLSEEMSVTAFSAKFGGFSGTAGSITLKVGNTVVGSGSLNEGTDVTVTAATSMPATGTVLTVIVEQPSSNKGIKAYWISYTVAAPGGGGGGTPQPTLFMDHRERLSNSLIYNSVITLG